MICFHGDSFPYNTMSGEKYHITVFISVQLQHVLIAL